MAFKSPYAHVQAAVTTTVTATTSRATTFSTQNITAGNMIFGWIWIGDVGARTSGHAASDGTNGSYTIKLIQVGGVSGTGGSFLFFWFLNAAGGVKPTVTASWTGSKATSAMVIHEYSGLESNYTYNTSASAHKTSTTAVVAAGVTDTHQNAFAFSAMWNSGANNLTDPPTALPSTDFNVIQSHGKISTTIYTDEWVQMGETGTSPGMGFTVSSSTNTTDVAEIHLSALENPLIQSTQTASGGTNFASTFMNFVSSGHVLTAIMHYYTGANTPTGEPGTRTLTDDSGSNAWVEAVHNWDSTTKTGISMWYCLSAAAGSPTMTASLSGNFTGNIAAANFELSLAEYTGTFTGSDGSHSSVSTGGTTSPTAGSFSTTVDGDLIVAAYVTTAAPGDYFMEYAGTGFLECAGTPFANLGMGSEYQLQTTHGAINPGFNLKTAGIGWTAAFALHLAVASTQPFMQMLLGVY